MALAIIRVAVYVILRVLFVIIALKLLKALDIYIKKNQD
jgi:hypothetical protein